MVDKIIKNFIKRNKKCRKNNIYYDIVKIERCVYMNRRINYVLLIMIFTIIATPRIALADGLNLDNIIPDYDTSKKIVLNENKGNYDFSFIFLESNSTMSYKATLVNDSDIDLYITNIRTGITNNNYEYEIEDLKEKDIIKSKESRIVRINITSTDGTIIDVDEIVNIAIEYEDAALHNKANLPISNPKTGLKSYIFIIIISVLLYIIYLKIRQKNYFKNFTFVLLFILIIGTIFNVIAENVGGSLVINGLIKYTNISRICIEKEETEDNDENNSEISDVENSDTSEENFTEVENKKICKGDNTDYGIYKITIDPNGGIYKKSPDKFIANYLADTVIDLGQTYRELHKLIDWNYNGEYKTFEYEDLVVKENADLEARWEYGPYYLLSIDPNNGKYNNITKRIRIWLSDKEEFKLEEPIRDRYHFDKWEETTNTSSLSENMVTINKRDVNVVAKWRNIYNINFDVAAQDATIDIKSKEVIIGHEYGDLPIPKRTGYVFLGWSIGSEMIINQTIFNYESDVTLVAKWQAKTDTKYIVNHYKMNVEGNNDLSTYIFDSKEENFGTTDTYIIPTTKIFEGFTSPDSQQVKIHGDGSTIVNYYYKRNKYSVNIIPSNILQVQYKNADNIFRLIPTTNTITAYYESTIYLYALSNAGYYYTYNNSEKTYNYKVPARNSVIRLDASYCGTGEYSSSGSASCSSCPEGYSCSTPGADPEICKSGTYSNTGDGKCSTCPTGTYSAEGSSKCTVCPPGYKCTIPSEEPKICPVNTYSSEGSTECKQCPAGKESMPGSITCTKNSYNLIVTIPNEGIRAVFYKVNGDTEFRKLTSTMVIPVENVSTYYLYAEASPGYTLSDEYTSENPLTGVMTNSGASYSPIATKCSGGYSCSGGIEKPVLCAAGTYANPGSSTCTTCPAGSKCVDGTATPEICAAGTYSPVGSSTCTTCPAGSKCPTGAGEPTICSINTYSGTGAADCTKCPTGHSSGSGATSCTPIQSTVTFNSNGGTSPSIATKNVTYGSTYGNLPTTSKNYYVFDGWYTATSGGTKITESTTVTITDKQTLYAQWKPISLSVAINFNNVTVKNASNNSISSGSTINFPEGVNTTTIKIKPTVTYRVSSITCNNANITVSPTSSAKGNTTEFTVTLTRTTAATGNITCTINTENNKYDSSEVSYSNSANASIKTVKDALDYLETLY